MTDEEKFAIQTDRIEKLVFSSKAISEKYIYYLLAVDAACVGFSINLSKDLTLSLYTIPLGLAVVLWGISFTYGLIQITSFERLTELNIIELKSEIYKTQLTNEQNLEMFRKQDEIKRQRHKQNIYFALGVASFLLWHIWRMYNNC